VSWLPKKVGVLASFVGSEDPLPQLAPLLQAAAIAAELPWLEADLTGIQVGSIHNSSGL